MQSRILALLLLVGCSSDREAHCASLGLVYDPESETCECRSGTTFVCADGGTCACELDAPADGGRPDAAPDAFVAVEPDACAPRAFYRDADGDGHGDPEVSETACTASDGYVPSDDDCDDACAACHPGAAEVCSSAIDEDCDGDPVTGCGCTIGTRTDCAACGDACGWACAPSGCNDAVQVVAGSNHTCALREDHSVVCWGSGYSGQLGNGASGTAASSRVPLAVGALPAVRALAAGSQHTCALTDTAELYCWGDDEFGQLGDGRSGVATLSTVPVRVAGLTGVTHVAAGGQHTCAVVAGALRCWGFNFSGQLGNGRSGAGELSTAPVTVSGVTGVVGLAAGAGHTCAIDGEGHVWCWGDNARGQLGDATTTLRSRPVEVYFLFGVTVIAAGLEHTCAIDGVRDVACWGDNRYGQLGNGLSGTGRYSDSPGIVSGIFRAELLAAGSRFTCATVEGPGARCWGDNTNGALGDGRGGTGVLSPTPVTVASLDVEVTSIECGQTHGVVVTASGEVRAWGGNLEGQLGDGTRDNRIRPVPTLPP